MFRKLLLISIFSIGGLMAAIPEITVTSPMFDPNGPIPKKYTCEGDDVSPPLVLSGLPVGTVTLAIIVDDPDAPMGDFVHWVAWNIDPAKKELQEGISLEFQGQNDFRVNRYRGPCPPRGKPHRYFFKIFAIDTILNLPPKTTKSTLLEAMKGHIRGQGELIGTYQR